MEERLSVSRWPWRGTCVPLGCGWRLDASGSAFGKQFKRADRSGARWAMVLGDEEAERGEVRLKPLQQQAEESIVALAPVAAIVEKLLTP